MVRSFACSASDNEKSAADPRCVLVLDEDAVSQTVIVRTLEKQGYRVDTAKSGEEIVSKYTRARYMLVLADLYLLGQEPVLTQVRALKETSPGLPILGLGLKETPRESRSNIPFDLNGFLEKPLTVEALKHTVGRWIPGFAVDRPSHRAA